LQKASLSSFTTHGLDNIILIFKSIFLKYSPIILACANTLQDKDKVLLKEELSESI
jgi:hypothetical protein